MSEWVKRDFKTFSADYGIELSVKSAPSILYPKKDKEHEAFNSLVGFFLISGGLLIFIALYLILAGDYFSLVLLIIVILVAVGANLILLLNYLKSNVYIRPLECWMEIFEGQVRKHPNVFRRIEIAFCTNDEKRRATRYVHHVKEIQDQVSDGKESAIVLE